MTTTKQAIGNRVLLRRRALGWSQDALARRCGFSYQVVCRLERGKQSIYAERLAVLAQHLGVSADYLLGIGESAEGPSDACQPHFAPPGA